MPNITYAFIIFIRKSQYLIVNGNSYRLCLQGWHGDLYPIEHEKRLNSTFMKKHTNFQKVEVFFDVAVAHACEGNTSYEYITKKASFMHEAGLY